MSFNFVNAQTKFPTNSEPVKKQTIKVESERKATSVVAKEESVKSELANASIDFVSKVVDYGTIDYKGNGDREFVFTNNGTEPLIIKNAKGSCGCTVPTWPKGPIAPGATEKIKVKYATTRVGKFTKQITLTTNSSKKPVILTIKGEVKAAPKPESAPVDGAPLEKK